jgi:general nucleoside transport system ATP-binding protein
LSDLLVAHGLTRRFGGTAAVDGVDLDVRAGEIHAVLGENGAGKTTLLRLLFGTLRPDAGTIRWRGQPVVLDSPRDAQALGIGMVHQHFMLVDALTVWENLWLAHPARPVFRLDRLAARRAVRDLSDRFSLDLDPDARVADLPVGVRQRLEIAKALTRPVELLILDEPTAVLTPPEIDALFTVMDELRAAGSAVLFVTHKLREVLRISDRVTVLRRGRVTAHCRTGEADEPSLTRSIVGDGATGWSRVPARRIPRAPEEEGRDGPGEGGGGPAAAGNEVLPGGVRLGVRGLSGTSAGRVPIRGVSFDVHAGEIVGLTGVDGNGQEELVALLAGVAAASAGRIEVAGTNVAGQSNGARRRAGLAVLPGDRTGQGLVADAPVWENLALRDFGAPWARAGGLVVPRRHVERAERRLRERDVRGTPFTRVRHLSGGNQQKLLLARELADDAIAVVLLNPTRGLDVGGADSLLRELVRLRDEGRAVLLVSTELDEVLRVADRVAVLVKGEWHDAPERTREAIGGMMLGGATP